MIALVSAACDAGPEPVAIPRGPEATISFAIDAANIADLDTWPLNRPIEIEFNLDVDFTTVSATTVEIVDDAGVPAVGSFARVSPRILRFQPACPTNETNSNGGLLQGRAYRLTLPTLSGPGGGPTVQSTSGQPLLRGLSLRFRTPESSDPRALFLDPVAGPPAVRVRGLGAEPLDSLRGSFVEFIGRDDDGDGAPDREFIVFDPMTQTGGISQALPLNLYSVSEDQFAVVLRFDQPVQSTEANISRERLGLEYFDVTGGAWRRLPTTVQLISNCTETGAEVRLSPEGVVPQGAELRAIVRAGFADLTGEAVLADLADFARFETVLANAGTPNEGDGADAFFESFSDSAREDSDLPSPRPRAAWNEASAPGTLAASLDFSGTGGPGGDFTWRLPVGLDLVLNTDADVILGGPNGFPVVQQQVIGGLVQVENLIIEEGASLTLVGSNTCIILATGFVEIRGEIRLDGNDARAVLTLNTTNVPEPGARGNAGGGDGGTASAQTQQSTARGGPGQGAFGAPNLGGEGGETGYALGGSCAKENRRGAGGGGGRLGRDVRYLFNGALVRCQMLVGMDAERGIVGSLDGTGAVSQSQPAQGGQAGPSPFIDLNPDNDFFGVIVTADGRQIRGELPMVWAGAGGGAGGDASSTSTFPMTPFNPQGDQKGAGGGGGAGGLQILAIGDISIVGSGSISADGGTGNGGESTIFFDRVGGGSGGGSGGHIVLSSAGRIVIESEAAGATVGPFYDDSTASLQHIKRPIRALGGQGGAGRESRCGANENNEQDWARDSIPVENFDGNPLIPPQNGALGILNWAQVCSTGNINQSCQTPPATGETFGAGGDGGPGIIQLHVPDPATQLVFAGAQGGGVYGVSADPTYSMVPPPYGWTSPTDPVDLLVPLVSARSEAFSQWIPLGLARLNANGTADQVEFLFGGTDPATGTVLRAGGAQAELAPLVAYTALTSAGSGPSVDAPTATFTFEGASSIDPAGLYIRNAALMREFALRVRDGGAAATEREFIVQTAVHDALNDRFLVTVDPRGTTLGDTLNGVAAPEVELVPYFFRLQSGGVLDAYPAGTEVAIRFDAARANASTGEPSADPADVFSGNDIEAFTPDITDLNSDTWDFFRIKFEFLIDLDRLDDPRPGLDFVKVPFRY